MTNKALAPFALQPPDHVILPAQVLDPRPEPRRHELEGAQAALFCRNTTRRYIRLGLSPLLMAEKVFVGIIDHPSQLVMRWFLEAGKLFRPSSNTTWKLTELICPIFEPLPGGKGDARTLTLDWLGTQRPGYVGNRWARLKQPAKTGTVVRANFTLHHGHQLVLHIPPFTYARIDFSFEVQIPRIG